MQHAKCNILQRGPWSVHTRFIRIDKTHVTCTKIDYHNNHKCLTTCFAVDFWHMWHVYAFGTCEFSVISANVLIELNWIWLWERDWRWTSLKTIDFDFEPTPKHQIWTWQMKNFSNFSLSHRTQVIFIISRRENKKLTKLCEICDENQKRKRI